MGGADALDELRPVGDTAFADEVDIIQANEWREIGFATRELLVDRVNALSSALDRVNAGDYGTCTECGEEIAPARLRVLPEVETCVRCQDRIERYGRENEADEVEVGVAEEDRVVGSSSGGVHDSPDTPQCGTAFAARAL
jgi:RNA polymerase-binding transcription factor DksA